MIRGNRPNSNWDYLPFENLDDGSLESDNLNINLNQNNDETEPSGPEILGDEIAGSA